jgi:hypothetical protein
MDIAAQSTLLTLHHMLLPLPPLPPLIKCRSFENSIAACAAPVVGLLAERVFGFTGVLNEDSLKDSTIRAHNAAALGSSLLACMTVPWSLCLLAYSALHWFYPKDKARAKAWGAGSSQGVGAAYHH